MGRTRFIAAYQTQAGRNTINQDACDVFDTVIPEGRGGPRRTLKVAVVADGINGHQGGDRASGLAVNTIKRELSTFDVPVLKAMQDAIQKANEEIYKQALNDPKLRGMGCTVIVAIFDTDRLYLAHVGDSRAYLIRSNTIYQLTEDHLREARIPSSSPELARRLGRTSKVNVDLAYIPLSTESPHANSIIGSLPLRRGDSVLLCTDGLTDNFRDDYLKQIITGRRPKFASQRLIKAVNQAGAHDDVTAIVVRWPYWTRRIILFGLLLLLMLGMATIRPALAAICSDNLDKNNNLPFMEQIRGCFNSETNALTPTKTPTVSPSVTPIPSSTPSITWTPESTSTTQTDGPAAESVTVEPTATASITNTPTPSHTPTPTPTKAEIFTATATPRPTSTFTATPTPNSSTETTVPITPSAVVAITVPSPEASSEPVTPTEEPASTSNVCYQDVTDVKITLLEPMDGATSPDDQNFSWYVNCELGPNQAFEPIFWQPSENPSGQGKGLIGTVLTHSARIGYDDAIVQDVGNVQLLWSVRIVQAEPYSYTIYTYDAVESAARHYTFSESRSSTGGNTTDPCDGATGNVPGCT
ncbi:MAG: protein phosphatase 2C domain-containing protein [Caldilineaceae bacterium]